jgi:hypothetical protein
LVAGEGFIGFDPPGRCKTPASSQKLDVGSVAGLFDLKIGATEKRKRYIFRFVYVM